MQKIDELRQEIKAFSDEIEKLQAELATIGRKTLQLASGESASDISSSVRGEAIRIIEQQPVIQGLKNAIAELTSRLVQKKAQLQELETAELKRETTRRAREGQSRLRAKFSDVETAAQSLQNLFFELKAIALEYEADFAQIHPPTSGHKQLNRAALLNYEVLALPTITEENQRFILNSRFINLFEAERKAIERQRLEQSQTWRQNHQQQMAEIKQRELDEQLRIEEKERQSLLKSKRSQLTEYEDARRNRLASLATANVSGFDDAIAQLEEDIKKLQESSQDG